MSQQIVNVFLDCFWATATALVPVIVPLVALCVMFTLAKALLWK